MPVVALVDRAGDTQLGSKGALLDLHLQLGHIDSVLARLDGWMFVKASLQSSIDIARRQTVQRTPRRQLGRFDTNDLAIGSNTVAQGRLGQAGLGPRGRETGFSLGNVRPGDLADVEPILGLTQLLIDDLDVVALQVENGRVPQNVHIGRRGVEQDALLGAVQGFPRTENGGFRRTDPVLGPKPIENCLIELNADPARVQRTSSGRVRREPR
jgi:hypothetical protein